MKNTENELNSQLGDVKNQLSDTRNQLKNTENELNSQLGDVNNELEVLQKNPVPIGFIYVQLPNQSEPQTLWPTVEWENVTSEYAGFFFRAEGGNSSKFGDTQNENIPTICYAKYNYTPFKFNEFETSFDFSPGSYVRLKTGVYKEHIHTNYDSETGLEIKTSSGEVRPRNMAIRIWKRTK